MYKLAILSVIIFSLGIVSFAIINSKEAMPKNREIQLPKPVTKGGVSLEETITKRRSQRSFQNRALTLEQISQLLWAGQGITKKQGGFAFRAAPSAGALYPMEIYVATKDGLFHYLPEEHILEALSDKDVRSALADASLGQDSISQAPLDIIICALYSRVTSKYGKRGIRYADIEAGHIAQNIHLQAVALGLGSVPIGAFSDEEVMKIISLDTDCTPLYIIPVGYYTD